MGARAWRRAGALGAGLVMLLATAGTALGGRAWTIDASPTSLDVGVTATVTLDVRNTGGDGGGNEIGCIIVTIAGGFTIEDADVSSVKGAASGHGWVTVVSGSKVGFMEPTDSNVLVGLPTAGDGAVFRITVTPTGSGAATWSAAGYDKPGSGAALNCGSGRFPTIVLPFSVAPAPTPRPTPTPTPRPTPAPTPTPSPTPAPTATPAPTPAPTAAPSTGPSPQPTPRPTAAPTPSATSVPTPSEPDGPSPSPDPAAGSTPSVSPDPVDATPTPTPAITAAPGESATPPPLSGGASGGGASSGGTDTRGAAESNVSSGGSTAGASALTVGRTRDGRDTPAISAGALQDAALGAFAAIGFGAFAVPGLVMGVPGLLLVLAVLFQLLGGSAFVPIARRWQRGIGLRRRPVARIVRDH